MGKEVTPIKIVYASNGKSAREDENMKQYEVCPKKEDVSSTHFCA